VIIVVLLSSFGNSLVRASIQAYPSRWFVLGSAQPSGPTGLLRSTLSVSQFLKKTTTFSFPTDACDRRWRIHRAARPQLAFSAAFSSVRAPHLAPSRAPPHPHPPHGVAAMACTAVARRQCGRKGEACAGQLSAPPDLSLLSTVVPHR
jgi:hypothetical protein